MGTDMPQAMQERNDGDHFFSGKRRLPRFRNRENVEVSSLMGLKANG
jgi:hypothetical protein